MRISWPIFTIAAAFLVLVASSLHYPLATTFPIGGDAASYIRDSTRLISAFSNPVELLQPATYSRYPLTQISFALFTFLPIDWAERYVWFTAISSIIAGSSLALLAFRISDWRAAAILMVIWGATSVTVHPHINDGTIAQLLSLAPLFLFFERLYARSYGLATISLLAALLYHPLTGIIGLLSAYAALIVGFNKQDRRPLFAFALPLAAATVLAIVLLTNLRGFFANVPVGGEIVSFPDTVRSFIAPIWVLAPAGLILLLKRIRKNPLGISAIAAFTFLSLLFVFNNHLDIFVWTHRFKTYLISAITLLSSIALPLLLASALPKRTRVLQAGVIFLLLAAISIGGWNAASYVFAYNESPVRYGRIHPGELAAIHWMAANLPDGSIVISTQENRHTEWIPILTNHVWHGIHGNIPLEELESGDYTHVIYLKKREKAPEYVRERFQPMYETNEAVIFSLIL